MFPVVSDILEVSGLYTRSVEERNSQYTSGKPKGLGYTEAAYEFVANIVIQQRKSMLEVR
jgi:hypothetical protein